MGLLAAGAFTLDLAIGSVVYALWVLIRSSRRLAPVAPIGVDVTSGLILLGAVVLIVGACGSNGAKCCEPSGSAAATCQGLQESFFAALPAAQSCASGSAGQCQKTLPLPVVGCPSPICLVAVNDDSALMPIETQWNLLGCSQLPGYGCAQGCRQATTGVCTAQDGGSISDP
jgi:hypothetical protein